jgi:hypothetical protein
VTDLQTRYIGFDGSQIAVTSNVPEVWVALEKSFRRMLQPVERTLVDRLEVTHTPEGYIFRSSRSWIKTRSLDEILMNLDNEVILQFIFGKPSFLWLHAGAAAFAGRAALVCGASGHGKSTTIAALCRLGWHFLADDITPLDPHADRVFPFPLTPMYRPHPGGEVPPNGLRDLPKVEAAIDQEALCQEAVSVGMLIFPSYGHRQVNELTPYPASSAALDLLQNCVNVAIRREAAFKRLTKLAQALPAFRLTYSCGAAAADLLAHATIDGAFRTQVRDDSCLIGSSQH